MGCFISKHGLQPILDKMLRRNKTGSSRDVASETVRAEMLRKHWSIDGVYKVTDAIKAQANDSCERIANGDTILKFVERPWICGFGVPTLQKYDWEKNKVILKEKTLGGRFVHLMFASGCFGPTERTKFSVVM